jgi:hypothetical protein
MRFFFFPLADSPRHIGTPDWDDFEGLGGKGRVGSKVCLTIESSLSQRFSNAIYQKPHHSTQATTHRVASHHTASLRVPRLSPVPMPPALVPEMVDLMGDV